MRTPGQIGYEAYGEAVGWQSVITGDTLPMWQDLDPRVQKGWESSASAVLMGAQAIEDRRTPMERHHADSAPHWAPNAE